MYSYTLLKNIEGINIELVGLIKGYILLLIDKGVLKVIDKQKDLIFKLNEYEESSITLEELYFIDNLTLLVNEDSCVEMSTIYKWVEENSEKINKYILKTEKKVRKLLEQEGYLSVKLKIWKIKLGRSYSLTEKGKERLEDLIGLHNYLEDIHILSDKLVYSKELWDNYMLWSTLYSKEKSTRAYLKRINSEYFNSTHLNIGYISVRM